jgi:hypothetical protein
MNLAKWNRGMTKTKLLGLALSAANSSYNRHDLVAQLMVWRYNYLESTFATEEIPWSEDNRRRITESLSHLDFSRVPPDLSQLVSWASEKRLSMSRHYAGWKSVRHQPAVTVTHVVGAWSTMATVADSTEVKFEDLVGGDLTGVPVVISDVVHNPVRDITNVTHEVDIIFPSKVTNALRTDGPFGLDLVFLLRPGFSGATGNWRRFRDHCAGPVFHGVSGTLKVSIAIPGLDVMFSVHTVPQEYAEAPGAVDFTPGTVTGFFPPGSVSVGQATGVVGYTSLVTYLGIAKKHVLVINASLITGAPIGGFHEGTVSIAFTPGNVVESRLFMVWEKSDSPGLVTLTGAEVLPAVGDRCRIVGINRPHAFLLFYPETNNSTSGQGSISALTRFYERGNVRLPAPVDITGVIGSSKDVAHGFTYLDVERYLTAFSERYNIPLDDFPSLLGINTCTTSLFWKDLTSFVAFASNFLGLRKP